jgi:hypothetical protein
LSHPETDAELKLFASYNRRRADGKETTIKGGEPAKYYCQVGKKDGEVDSDL